MRIDNETPLISVMICVYKGEKFIERCMHSLLNQTMQKGVEVIIVNDCTPDKTMEIIRKMIVDDTDKSEMTFQLVEHPENMGLVEARKTAMSHATGVYTIFVDNDDYFELDMLEKMYAKAIETDADVVVADIWLELEQKSVYHPMYGSERQFLGGLVRGTWSALWNKLIRRSLYVDNEISWIKGTDWKEDYFVMLSLCFATKKISHIPEAFYHYVQYNSNSISKAKIPELRIACWLYAVEFLQDFIIKKQITGYDVEVGYLKLQIKINCMSYARGKQRKQLAALYPEADVYKKGFLRDTNSWKIKLINYCFLNRYFVVYSTLIAINKLCKKFLSFWH